MKYLKFLIGIVVVILTLLIVWLYFTRSVFSDITSINQDGNLDEVATTAAKPTTLPSESLELNIKNPKEIYVVGETLEGAEYYLKYTGEPFKGMVLYSQSAQGLLRKSYSSMRGTITSGSFDDPESMPEMKVSIYSIGPDGTPNPFDCDGTFVYSISVYDCAAIDNIMKTNDCGQGGYPPTIETEQIVTSLTPLKTITKSVVVECNDSTDCCTNWNFRCSSNAECMEGYGCKNEQCAIETNK